MEEEEMRFHMIQSLDDLEEWNMLRKEITEKMINHMAGRLKNIEPENKIRMWKQAFASCVNGFYESIYQSRKKNWKNLIFSNLSEEEKIRFSFDYLNSRKNLTIKIPRWKSKEYREAWNEWREIRSEYSPIPLPEEWEDLFGEKEEQWNGVRFHGKDVKRIIEREYDLLSTMDDFNNHISHLGYMSDKDEFEFN